MDMCSACEKVKERKGWQNIYQKPCLTLFRLLFGTTRKGKDRFPRPRLRHSSTYITENRIRCTTGPVRSPIPLQLYYY